MTAGRHAAPGSSRSAAATAWPPPSAPCAATPATSPRSWRRPTTAGRPAGCAARSTCPRPATSAGASRRWPATRAPARPGRSSTASRAATSRATPSATCSWPGCTPRHRRLRGGRRRGRPHGGPRPRRAAGCCRPPLDPVVLRAEATAGAGSPARWRSPHGRGRAGGRRAGHGPRAPPRRSSAVAEADQVVLGPGLAVHVGAGRRGGRRRARRRQRATGRARVYVCNLRAEAGRDPGLRRGRPRRRRCAATASSPTSCWRPARRAPAVGATPGVEVVEADVGCAPHGLAHDPVLLAAVLARLARLTLAGRPGCPSDVRPTRVDRAVIGDDTREGPPT